MNTDHNENSRDGGDSFEERLRGTPLATAPADLRFQILRKAEPDRKRHGVFASFVRHIFWPNPLAWGGIAALWLITLGFRIATPRFDRTENQVSPVAVQDDETRRAGLAQRAELLAWLRTDSHDLPADRDRSKPKTESAPRSSLNLTNRFA